MLGPTSGRNTTGGIRRESVVYIWTERGAGIQRWLDRTGFGVEAFIIVDDADMGALLPRFFRTDFRLGLTSGDIGRAQALLVSMAADPR